MKRFLFLCLGMVFSFSIQAGAQVTTGEPAKDFTLKDTNGAEYTLSLYLGQFVVLEWINHDCPFVRKHYDSNNMQALQKTYTEKGVVWLSINSSNVNKQGHYPPQKANKLTQQKGASPTAVLLDTDGKVGRLYGAKTTPHMFIINPEGILVYQGAIDDIPSTDKNDIPKAKNYVKMALDEVMDGKAVSVSTTQSYGCSVKY